MSLSTLLDIHQPQDLLRGLLNVITEFEYSKEEGENKSKMVCHSLYVLRQYLIMPEAFQVQDEVLKKRRFGNI
jgi:hypothetical protein